MVESSDVKPEDTKPEGGKGRLYLLQEKKPQKPKQQQQQKTPYK